MDSLQHSVKSVHLLFFEVDSSCCAEKLYDLYMFHTLPSLVYISRSIIFLLDQYNPSHIFIILLGHRYRLPFPSSGIFPSNHKVASFLVCPI